MATSTPNRIPSTPPPAAPRAPTRKPSAKVLETQQALRTHTTAAQLRQARTRTTASQSYAEEAPSAQQLADDGLQPFPTQRESISPERGRGSARPDGVIQLITSLKETIAQQSNIIASQTNTIASQTSAIESIRADLAAVRAEQQNLRDQNAELQETIQQLREQLDNPPIEPQWTPTWADVAASGRPAKPDMASTRVTNAGTRREDSRRLVIDVSKVREGVAERVATTEAAKNAIQQGMNGVERLKLQSSAQATCSKPPSPQLVCGTLGASTT